MAFFFNLFLVFLLLSPGYAQATSGLQLELCRDELLLKAAQRVIAAREKKNHPIPDLDTDDIYGDDSSFESVFESLEVVYEEGSPEHPLAMVQTTSFAKGKPLVDVSELTPVERAEIAVIRAQTQKGVMFFRPADEIDTGLTRVRKTLAASLLNQALKIESFPVTIWARLNGRLGSLSEQVAGNQLLSQLTVAVDKGHVTAQSASELEGFEFLIGQFDGVYRNYHVGPDGHVRGYDADMAFFPALMPFHHESIAIASDLIVGERLPRSYSQRFVEGIRGVTPSKLEKLLSDYLSEEEILGVIFRREILLSDIKARGKGVIAF